MQDNTCMASKRDTMEFRKQHSGIFKRVKSKLTERNLMQIELEVDNEKFNTCIFSAKPALLYYKKEAVTNILKHAAAKQIIINIWFQNNNCFLR